jgi:cytochrome P450
MKRMKHRSFRDPNLTIDFTSEQFLSNLYSYLDIIRETQGLYHDPFLNRFFILRYSDAMNTLRNPKFIHDLRKADIGTASHRLLQRIGEQKLAMLFQDAPRHTQLRESIGREFTPRQVEHLRPATELMANSLLDEIQATPSFDLISSYVAPLTTQTITEFVGIDPINWQNYRDLTKLDNQIFFTNLPLEHLKEIRRAQDELETIFLNTTLDRRKRTKEDLISKMIMSEHNFSDQEIVTMCRFLIRAGNLTLTDLIGNGLSALLHHQSELEKIKKNPALIVDAVEEILRFDTSALEAGRITSEGVTVSGTFIPPGQTVMISLAAVNHDPSKFENPEHFDITRKEKNHLSFGGGAHFCLGASFARMEAQVAIGTLLKRFPNLQLSKAQLPQRHVSPSFRGFSTLFVDLE